MPFFGYRPTESRYYLEWPITQFKDMCIKDNKPRSDEDMKAIIYAFSGLYPSEIISHKFVPEKNKIIMLIESTRPNK